MKVLWLSPWFPYPLENGSKIRIFHLMRSLAKHHSISLISFVRSGEQVQPEGLKDICVSVDKIAWRPFNATGMKSLVGYFFPTPRSIFSTYTVEMDRVIAQKVHDGYPDLIVASEIPTANYLTRYPNSLKIFEDVELLSFWDAWMNAHSRLDRLRRYLTLVKSKRYLSRLLRNFQAATVVSQEEKSLIQELTPDPQKIFTFPNGVDVQTLHPGLALPQPGCLIYPGSPTYSANYDAISFFLAEIFPKISTVMPDIKFRITGSTQGVDLSKLSLTPQVTLTGYVQNIHREISQAWVCVVPLRQGGGSRLKILEAMALGTPVVSTSKGAQGIQVTPGKDILIADDPIQFANETLRLLNNANLRATIATNARKLVEHYYDWDKIGEEFCQLVNHLHANRSY